MQLRIYVYMEPILKVWWRKVYFRGAKNKGQWMKESGRAGSVGPSAVDDQQAFAFTEQEVAKRENLIVDICSTAPSRHIMCLKLLCTLPEQVM